jgi:hypothetical protein
LEVFDPNAPAGLDATGTPGFVNDCIARTLAGVAQAGRPVFLKIVYHGPSSMEELVSYDPHLVVGILGGGAGTTYDAFKLIAEAQKYGARAALFGRKINNAECQLAFVEFLRRIVDRQISPEEAVRAYHGVLGKLGIKPQRSLADDMQLQTSVMSYGGGSTASVPAAISAATGEAHSHAHGSCGCKGPDPKVCECKAKKAAAPAASTTGSSNATASGEPDFAKMTQAEKLAYNKAKRDRVFG